MFLGEFVHSFDEKGRLTLPAKYREVLAGGVVVTKGIDSESLTVYPRPDWEAFAENIRGLSSTNKNARNFKRHIFSSASDIIPDRQGRVLISQVLREYAQLENSAVIIGVDNLLEIWNPERWAEVKAQVESESESIAEAVGDLGF